MKYTSLFSLCLFLCYTFDAVFSFNAVPTAIVTQIALLQNSTIEKTIQPVLTTSFFGYIDQIHYKLPLAGAYFFTTDDDVNGLYNSFGYGDNYYQVGQNRTDEYRQPSIDMTPTNPAARALLSISRDKYGGNVWGKSLSVIALIHFVTQFHNPTPTTTLVNDDFPQGDEHGKRFLIDYTSPTGTKYENLFDLFSYGLGFIAPNGLDYSKTSFTQKDYPLIQEEAERIIKMFPTETWNQQELNPIPPTFTRAGAQTVFDAWSLEGVELAAQVYNSLYPPVAHSLDFQTQQHTLMYLENDRMNNMSKPMNFGHSAFRQSPIRDETGPKSVPISQEQITWWRYMMFRSIAKAGYRLSHLLDRATPNLNGPHPTIHQGWVSRYWRALFIVIAIIFVFFTYLAITFYVKSRKQSNKAQSTTQQINSDTNALDEVLI